MGRHRSASTRSASPSVDQTSRSIGRRHFIVILSRFKVPASRSSPSITNPISHFCTTLYYLRHTYHTTAIFESFVRNQIRAPQTRLGSRLRQGERPNLLGPTPIHPIQIRIRPDDKPERRHTIAMNVWRSVEQICALLPLSMSEPSSPDVFLCNASAPRRYSTAS
jgi:hypothetical protein